MELTAAPAKPPRIHSLDFMRCIFVTAAVYLHVYQIFSPDRAYVKIDTVHFEEFESHSQYWFLMNQHQEGWRSDYHPRIQMFGRQLTIPLVFWVSGMSLGLGKEKAPSVAKKVGIITVVGMLCNYVVYLVGPMDDRCTWWGGGVPTAPHYDMCTAKGLLINFGIAIGGGTFFQVLFQFWFTAFLLVFVLEAHPMVEALRELSKAHDESATEEFDRGRAAKLAGVYWVVTGGFYIFFTHMWVPTDLRRAAGLQMALAEPLFMAALAGAAYLPPSRGRAVRVCQYLAALAMIFSFCIIDVGSGNNFDGALVTYFHIFKQFFLLGFTMASTRKKSQPVVSKVYPIAIAMLVITYAPTNYYRSGLDTYPRFPFTLDRVLWTGGALTWVFCYDRVGTWTAYNGSLRPLFPGWNMGALAAFVVQCPIMALLSPLMRANPAVDPFAWTLVIFGLCTVPFTILEVRARSKQARAVGDL